VTALIVMVFVEISLQSHGHIPVLLNSKKWIVRVDGTTNSEDHVHCYKSSTSILIF
jgi:hypothetical protein